MSSTIQLIVGLGNPGPQYTSTRHNAGTWFVEKIAASYHQDLRTEKKFKGQYARIASPNINCHLLIPNTFMNLSGEAVQAITKFYQIPTNAILVAHDELDYDPGVVRIKQNGGHGGHNGLRNIIEHLKNREFFRLRIGIGHPRHYQQVKEVFDYVLDRPSKAEQQKIDEGLTDATNILDDLVAGRIEKAMKELHTKERF